MSITEQHHHKITADHLKREACVYVRQSSIRQVNENQESTRRQYALTQRAVALGWPPNRIRVVDEDQGKSGTSSEQRIGYRDLMERLACAEVGIVLSLDVSRLSRDNADWVQLLRVAAMSDTLISDDAKLYNPADSNDRLILGVLGTLSEYELLGIKARMLGGVRNAAKRGALKIQLPTGLVYNDDSKVELDPDQSVVDAIAAVFKNYRRLGTIGAVVYWMHQENLQLPARIREHVFHPDGELRWRLPDHHRIRSILRNPRYAGAYVYGRVHSKTWPDGSVHRNKVAQDQWHVCIPQAHVGYIDWEEYTANQANLESHRSSTGSTAEHNAQHPRNGQALLQSPKLICGQCGAMMELHYRCGSKTKKTSYAYLCKQFGRDGRIFRCQTIRGESVDAAIGEFVISMLNREDIDLALVVEQQVRAEFAQADAQRVQQVERLRYQAEQAQRRFFAVDPENRHVAANLEANWNACLKQLDEAIEERQAKAQQLQWELSDEQRPRLYELAQDFAQVWYAPQTQPQDRKRLFDLLIEDVTLLKNGYNATVKLRLRGGQTVILDPVSLPKPNYVARANSPEAVTIIRQLAPTHTDTKIAEQLNLAGLQVFSNEPFTNTKVRTARVSHGIPGYVELREKTLRAQGFVKATEIAERLGISTSTVRQWRKSSEHDWLQSIVVDNGTKLPRIWYKADEQNTQFELVKCHPEPK